jgi:hypothetical protein
VTVANAEGGADISSDADRPLRSLIHDLILFSRIPNVWSAMRKCALSSALFRRVEVPLTLK